MKALKYYMHIPIGWDLSSELVKLGKKYRKPASPKPHLTIIPPYEASERLIDPRGENSLLRNLRRITAELPKLVIEPEGFGCFDDGRVVIVKIKKTPALSDCFNLLLEEFRYWVRPGEDVRTRFNPHLTIAEIAEDLEAARGQELLDRLIGNTPLPAAFEAPYINLLRKSVDRSSPWLTVESFEFAPELVPVQSA